MQKEGELGSKVDELSKATLDGGGWAFYVNERAKGCGEDQGLL